MTIGALRKGAFVLAMTAGVITAGPALAGICAAQKDQVALKMRVMQSDLMVAALTCNQRPRYNAFVTNFRPELVKQGHMLRSFFQRNFGTSARAHLNAFVTRLANEASLRRTADTKGFCTRAAGLFDSFSARHGSIIQTIASSTEAAYPRGIEGCPQEAHATTVPLSLVAPSLPDGDNADNNTDNAAQPPYKASN